MRAGPIAALASAALQSRAGRPRRREFLGHARDGTPARLSGGEQAQGPPTNPVEMGLPDIACAVYRASQRPYRALFESVWGPQSFAVAWQGDVEQVCNRPGPATAVDPLPVHLSSIDRGRVGATFYQMAQSIAG